MLPIIYPHNETEFSTRGYGALADCTECTVIEELNGEYSLTLKYPKKGIHQEYLLVRNIIVCSPNADVDRQAFRIHKVNRSLKNSIIVYAYQLSYDLSGYPILPSEASGIANAITLLNNASGDFNIATDKTSNGVFKVDVPSSVRSWFSNKEGSLRDVFGGDWEFNFFDCKLLNHRGADNGVRISYGVNIVQYTKEINDTLYSEIIPYFSKQSGDDLITVSGNKISTGTTDFQRTLFLDVTDKFESKYGTVYPFNLAERLYANERITVTSPWKEADEKYFFIANSDLNTLGVWENLSDISITANDAFQFSSVSGYQNNRYGMAVPVKVEPSTHYKFSCKTNAYGKSVIISFANASGSKISSVQFNTSNNIISGEFNSPNNAVWAIFVFVPTVLYQISTWSDISLASQPSVSDVTSQGTAYASANPQLINDSQSIVVEPTTFNTPVSIGDSVHIIYDETIVDTRVVKTIWDVLAERYTKIELGTVKENIAETIRSLGMKSTSIASGGSSGGGSGVVIDSELSAVSGNPVMNRVITNALNAKSTVSVNRKTTSGTNIADIIINGAATSLYAPEGGSNLKVMTDAEIDEMTPINGTATKVQSDWNATDVNSFEYIKNKPSIPSGMAKDVELGIDKTTNNPYINWVNEDNVVHKLSLIGNAALAYQKTEDNWQTVTELWRVNMGRETASIPISFAGDARNAKFYKIGMQVYGKIEFANTSNFTSATGYDFVGTLPDGWRPNALICTPISLRTVSFWASATYYPCFINIGTDGIISVVGNKSQINSCQYLNGVVSFVIA